MNKTTRHAALLAGAAAVALTIVMAGIMPGRSEQAPAAPVADTEQRMIVANGTIQPISDEISVGTQVLGTLARVPVREGEHVRAEQIVAEVDNGDAAAAVERAAAQLKLQQATLEKLLNGARQEDRQRVAAEFQDADALLSLAQMVVRRQQPLARTGVVAPEDFERSMWNLASARARQQAAQQNLTLINAPPRPEDVAVAQAEVTAASAQLAVSQATLEKTRIRSPIDGTVLRLLRRAGEPVGIYPPSIVAIIGNISTLRVVAEVDESDVAEVHAGQQAYVTADAYMGQRFAGTVTRVADSLGRKQLHSDDPAQRLDAKVLEVFIALDKDARLPVGLRVDVFIRPDPAQG